MERVLFFTTIMMLLFNFYEYLLFPLYGCVIGEFLIASCQILSYVVITEEVIKYCSVAHPNSTVHYINKNLRYLIEHIV